MHIRGEVAKVHARYSCDVGDHIWVSVKQNAAADIDPSVSAEGPVQFCITNGDDPSAIRMEWSRVVKNR